MDMRCDFCPNKENETCQCEYCTYGKQPQDPSVHTGVCDKKINEAPVYESNVFDDSGDASLTNLCEEIIKLSNREIRYVIRIANKELYKRNRIRKQRLAYMRKRSRERNSKQSNKNENNT